MKQRAAKYLHRIHSILEKPQLVALPPLVDNLISFSDDDLKALDYAHTKHIGVNIENRQLQGGAHVHRSRRMCEYHLQEDSIAHDYFRV